MKLKKTAYDLCIIAMMAAILEVSKFALSFLANIELVTFFVIMFALHFKNKIYAALPVFIVVEGLIYGFGDWWVMYIYSWPLLALAAQIMKRLHIGYPGFVALSTAFGLMFGLLCSPIRFFIGLSSGGVMAGLNTMLSWWISGIPYDILHGFGNFVIMLALFIPMDKALAKLASKRPNV